MTVKFCLMKNQDTQTPTKKKYLVSIFETVQINKKPEQMKYYCITFQPRESPIRWKILKKFSYYRKSFD